MNAIAPANYLDPDVPGILPWHDVPVLLAAGAIDGGFGVTDLLAPDFLDAARGAQA